MASSAKGRKVQVWIWDSFQNFFQAAVCKGFLLAQIHWYFYCIQDKLMTYWLQLMSMWWLSAVITRKKKCVQICSSSQVEWFCFIWYCEQQWSKRKAHTQQGEKRVCERVKKGQVSLGSAAKFEKNLSLAWFFSCFLPLTYLCKHSFHLKMVASLLSILNCPLDPLCSPFIGTSWIFQGPQKTQFISCHSSPSTFTSVCSRCSIFGIPVLTEDHLRQSILSLHTPSSSMRMTFSPHTHPTRPSHPLIYRQHGGLSWQRPSCDVFSLMCMALLSVKLCFTINKTGCRVEVQRIGGWKRKRRAKLEILITNVEKIVSKFTPFTSRQETYKTI